MMQFITFKQALRQALDEGLANNQRMILLGEDLRARGGASGVAEGFYGVYGEQRVLDTPVSESAVIGTAVGAAMTGLVPVVEMGSSDFAAYGMDSLVNEAAKIAYLSDGAYSVPIVVRLPSGGATDSELGHSQNLESLFANVPGLTVVAPTTPAQAKGLLTASINSPNPVVFIENKELYDTSGPVPEEAGFSLELGKSLREREGNDVTVVSWGPALIKVKEVLGVLEREGISAELINPLTLYPMDMEPIYDSVIKTSRLVIVHDGPKDGGIGAEIAAKVVESDCFDYLDAPIKRVAGLDLPTPFNRELAQLASPQKEEILDAIYTVTGMK